jgi:tRNA(Ile)-lysidine synthase
MKNINELFTILNQNGKNIHYNQAMLARILETAQNECRLIPGQTLLVGVSGGPDSLCLLDALRKLDFQIIAAYFNHHLRDEAEEEACFVEREASRMGAQFVLGNGDVRAVAQGLGLSVEAAARDMRYRFLFDRARDFRADAVAVAHNADDQVETVFMHLLRGSGLDGLCGMRYYSLTGWDKRIPLVRPLLNCWREEIITYCAEAGLHPVLDRSNLEPIYLRNRIRLNFLPELERLMPGANRRIWNLSQLAAGDLKLVAGLEDQAWQQCVLGVEAERIKFDLELLRKLDAALQRRLVRRAAAILRPSGEGMSLENTLRAVQFLQSDVRPPQIELGQRLLLRIDGRLLLLLGSEFHADLHCYPQMESDELLALSLPGQVNLGSGWTLIIEESGIPPAGAFQRPRGELQLDAWLDADSLVGRLGVRKPIAGDRFQPLGMAEGSQKLSDFWINRHIPAEARPAWPVVVCGEEILWLPGFSPAHRARIRPESVRCVHMNIQQIE